MWVWVVWEKFGKKLCGETMENNNMGNVWKICEKNSVEKMWTRILWEKCGQMWKTIAWENCGIFVKKIVWKKCGQEYCEKSVENSNMGKHGKTVEFLWKE